MEKLIAEICRRIDSMEDRYRILIAIDGSCTAGKSTLAARLAADMDCNLFHMDDFFLRPSQRTPQRREEAGGNVDYERFQEEVLLPLKEGRAFSYRPYDCSTGRLGEPVQIQPKRINIVEGSYSHHPYFQEPYDLKVFLNIDPKVRLRRIDQRPAFLRERFLGEWIPMEQHYFRDFHIEEKADIIAFPADNR